MKLLGYCWIFFSCCLFGLPLVAWLDEQLPKLKGVLARQRYDELGIGRILLYFTIACLLFVPYLIWGLFSKDIKNNRSMRVLPK